MRSLTGNARLFSDSFGSNNDLTKMLKVRSTDLPSVDGAKSSHGFKIEQFTDFNFIPKNRNGIKEPFYAQYNEISTKMEFDSYSGYITDYVLNSSPFELMLSLSPKCFPNEEDIVKSKKYFNLDTINYLIKKSYERYGGYSDVTNNRTDYDSNKINAYGMNDGGTQKEGFYFGHLYDKPDAFRNYFNVLGVLSNISGNNETSIILRQESDYKEKKRTDKPKTMALIRKGAHEMLFKGDPNTGHKYDFERHDEVWLEFKMNKDDTHCEVYMDSGKNYTPKYSVNGLCTTTRIGRIEIPDKQSGSGSQVSRTLLNGMNFDEGIRRDTIVEKKIKIKINTF
jgi:hypothetical protein